MNIQHEVQALAFALQELEKSMRLFNEYEQAFLDDPTQENKDACIGMRDSMMQRFECCADLFWKILTLSINKAHDIDFESTSLHEIVHGVAQAGIMSQDEAHVCVDMLVNRDKMHHSYEVTLVEGMIQNMPDYYKLMRTVTERVQTKV